MITSSPEDFSTLLASWLSVRPSLLEELEQETKEHKNNEAIATIKLFFISSRFEITVYLVIIIKINFFRHDFEHVRLGYQNADVDLIWE